MNTTRTNGMVFTTTKAKAKVQLVLQSCKQGRTRQELEIILSLSKRTTVSYLRHLHSIGQLHITTWKRDGIGQFYPQPVYKTGPGVDAPKPPPLTEHERQVRAWAKLKADPVRYAKMRERRTGQKPPPANSPFNWRGRSSVFTAPEFQRSARATLATAGIADKQPAFHI